MYISSEHVLLYCDYQEFYQVQNKAPVDTVIKAVFSLCVSKQRASQSPDPVNFKTNTKKSLSRHYFTALEAVS